MPPLGGGVCLFHPPLVPNGDNGWEEEVGGGL